MSTDKDFKSRILDEQPEEIDVRRCARRSVHELGVAHLTLRKTIAEHVARARSEFESAIHDYKEAGADSVIGLCARHAGHTGADIPILLDWDDVRIQLIEKNDSPPQLWPRHTHHQPTTEQIIALREEAKHTQAQAAAAIFVSKERWQDYEDGLPMPEGLFLLYQLQVNRHKSHCLQPISRC